MCAIPQVVSTYIERETAKQEAAHARMVREGRAAWLRLLSALHMRMQLADSYEDQGAAGAAAAGANTSSGRKRKGAAAGGAEGAGGEDEGGEQGAPSVHEQAMEQVREYLAQQDQGGAGAAAPANAVAETEEI